MIYRFNRDIYEKNAVMKAAYRYTDKAYIHIDVDEKYYIVTITSKEDEDVVTEKTFQNTILAEMVRLYISTETKNVREMILARAFSSSIIEGDMQEEPEEKIFDIDDVLKDWFENDAES